MKDLVPGLTESIGKVITTWLLPALLATLYAAVLLWPAYTSYTVDLTSGAHLILAAAVAIAVGFTLAAASTFLTRVLEGYYLWPRAVRLRREQHHVARREELESAVQASTGTTRTAYRDRLNGYPRGDRILATRLGNALRAGESYGWVQYGLSVPDLWVHLTAVAPEPVTDALDRSRAVLDFFVAAIWLSMGLAVATIGGALASGDASLLWWAGGLVAATPLWYGGAVASVTWYRQAMWALVDLSRGKLAESLGIRLPGDLEAERAIWRAVTDYAVWGPEWSNSDGWVATITGATQPRGAEDPAASA